jgi:hypothetical protein
MAGHRRWKLRRVAGRSCRAWSASPSGAGRSPRLRRIVSGVTSSRSPFQRAFCIRPGSAASRARSAQFSLGRCGCCRCRTASRWRRIKISAVFHVSSRRDSRSHAASRVIRRNTNRRHMIGDHHWQSAGRATLLVRAVDATLGTHSSRAIGHPLRGRGAGVHDRPGNHRGPWNPARPQRHAGSW